MKDRREVYTMRFQRGSRFRRTPMLHKLCFLGLLLHPSLLMWAGMRLAFGNEQKVSETGQSVPLLGVRANKTDFVVHQ